MTRDILQSQIILVKRQAVFLRGKYLSNKCYITIMYVLL